MYIYNTYLGGCQGDEMVRHYLWRGVRWWRIMDEIDKEKEVKLHSEKSMIYRSLRESKESTGKVGDRSSKDM